MPRVAPLAGTPAERDVPLETWAGAAGPARRDRQRGPERAPADIFYSRLLPFFAAFMGIW